MRRPRIARSYRRKPVKFPPGALYALSLFAIVAILALRVFRRRRRYSKKQIEEYRNWKKGKSEEILASKIAKLQTKLENLKIKRKTARVREEQERLLAKAEALRDERGRAIYGDAWDNAEAGDCAPLRDLFALSDHEVKSLQSQAMNDWRTKQYEENKIPSLDLNTIKPVPRQPPQNLPQVNYYDTPSAAFIQNPLVSEDEATFFSSEDKRTKNSQADVASAPIQPPPIPAQPEEANGHQKAKHGNSSPPVDASPRIFPHDGGVIPEHLIPKAKPSASRPSPRVLPYPPPREEEEPSVVRDQSRPD